MAIAQLSEFQAPDPSPSTPLKVNNLQLVPYVEMNGSRTLPDTFLSYVFDEMVVDGLISTVFDGVEMKDARDFIRLMKHPSNLPVFAVQDQTCFGFAWLNGVGVNHAYGHFCYFKNERFSSGDFGEKVLNYWFSLQGATRPFLDVILGTVPAFNKKASHYVQKLGFVKLGEIPDLHMNRYTGEKCASIIHYLTRENHVESIGKLP